jgi:hypothetical protein
MTRGAVLGVALVSKAIAQSENKIQESRALLALVDRVLARTWEPADC